MESVEKVRFIYGESAAVVNANGRNHMIIGDLHIGAERRLAHKGIHIYDAVDVMLGKVKALLKEYGADSLIILGDVKDSILYPAAPEAMCVKRFFDGLKDYDVVVTRGNHDPHLEEIVSVRVVDELVINGFAFLHGHRWPTESAMRCAYIFAGHNHVAVSFVDKNRGFYNQKAWLVSELNRKAALEKYPNVNKEIKLVVMPAFNDLIIGMPVNEVYDENLSPLFRNNIFDYNKGKIYSLRGEPAGTPGSLKKSQKRSDFNLREMGRKTKGKK